MPKFEPVYFPLTLTCICFPVRHMYARTNLCGSYPNIYLLTCLSHVCTPVCVHVHLCACTPGWEPLPQGVSQVTVFPPPFTIAFLSSHNTFLLFMPRAPPTKPSHSPLSPPPPSYKDSSSIMPCALSYSLRGPQLSLPHTPFQQHLPTHLYLPSPN